MRIKLICVGFLLLLSSFAYSNYPLSGYVPGTAWVTISKVTGSDVARFEVQGGSLCGTNVFTVDYAIKGGKEQFATVLAAASAGKKIFIETWAGCPSTDVAQNWGMKVGAITIQY